MNECLALIELLPPIYSLNLYISDNNIYILFFTYTYLTLEIINKINFFREVFIIRIIKLIGMKRNFVEFNYA